LNKKETIDVVLNKFESLICSTESAQPSPNFIWILTNSTEFLRKNMTNNETFIDAKPSIDHIKLLNSTGKNSSNKHVSTLELFGSFDLYEKYIICMIEHPLLEYPYFKMTKINLQCMIYNFN
jgi:hypothetical protein